MLYFERPVPITAAECEALAVDWVGALDSFQTDPHANDTFMFVGSHLTESRPEVAWQVILRGLELAPEAHVGLIGADALENLLSWHAPVYLPLAEDMACKNERFRSALASVWQFEMPEEHWMRLCAFINAHPEWFPSRPGAT